MGNLEVISGCLWWRILSKGYICSGIIYNSSFVANKECHSSFSTRCRWIHWIWWQKTGNQKDSLKASVLTITLWGQAWKQLSLNWFMHHCFCKIDWIQWIHWQWELKWKNSIVYHVRKIKLFSTKTKRPCTRNICTMNKI